MTKKRTQDDINFEAMLVSALLGAGTNSAIAGTLLGGSVLGAVVGDVLNSDEGGDSLLDDLFD